MSSQDTSENINITLNHLNKLLIGVTIAQARGTYSFDESADLAETVKLVTKFLKYNSEQSEKKEKEQTQQTQQAQAQEQAQAQALALAQAQALAQVQVQAQNKLQQPQLPPHLQSLLGL